MDATGATAVLAQFPETLNSSHRLDGSPSHSDWHDAIAALVGGAGHDGWTRIVDGDHSGHHRHLEERVLLLFPDADPPPPIERQLGDWHSPHSNWLMRYARILTHRQRPA